MHIKRASTQLSRKLMSFSFFHLPELYNIVLLLPSSSAQCYYYSYYDPFSFYYYTYYYDYSDYYSYSSAYSYYFTYWPSFSTLPQCYEYFDSPK